MALAIIVVAFAVLIRLLFDPILHDKIPFITLLPAIAFATWIGGFRSGLTATVVGVFASAYFFIPPRHSLALSNLDDQISIVLYLFLGSGLIGIVESLRRSRRSIQEREQELKLLAESIPQMAWMANPDGYIYWYNRRCYEYTGTTLELMKGWVGRTFTIRPCFLR